MTTERTELKPERVQQTRTVERVVTGQATSDGAGVKLTRVLTQPLQRRLDPFLMLDAFRNENPDDYLAGFPNHPHRGFETITYMIAGRMRHRDSAGNEGLLENGGVQWMTAGRGVVHSEMPEQEGGLMEGFQLWLNLPASDKMREPWYRDFEAAAIPSLRTADGVDVRVIAGASHGVAGAVTRDATAPLYLDVHLPASVRFSQSLPSTHNAFLFVYRGDVSIAGKTLGERQMAILANDAAADGVVVEAGAQPARLLLIAGRPLDEPIAQYGPFVMNTQQEIQEALADYRDGRFGAQ
ncbi:MAG: pirin family protein [Aromatoleum sp.]|jgi:redox-sensitive bicupin YhaK (pirin superfamily)|uniref:pirin family protein n=1 Tax=Aromatoleum sp. TaxID=2307007 RepID=UPI0028948FBC|nr:pirin family protein [Aromatoleum sp.]MDT3672018.1 pirin family protein [Aromatoleum sp.]